MAIEVLFLGRAGPQAILKRLGRLAQIMQKRGQGGNPADRLQTMPIVLVAPPQNIVHSRIGRHSAFGIELSGVPYDPQCLELFQQLFTELEATAPVTRSARRTDGPALPFFEAYFSSFIEGTEFAMDEAAEIIFQGRIPAARPEDAHDVLGTWKVVSDSARCPAADHESRIIVPTIFRNNYLVALKALSQNRITGALVRTLDFAQRYTAAVDFVDL